jgi:hypothetical protein
MMGSRAFKLSCYLKLAAVIPLVSHVLTNEELPVEIVEMEEPREEQNFLEVIKIKF